MSLPAPLDVMVVVEPWRVVVWLVAPRVSAPPGVMFRAPVLVSEPPLTWRLPLMVALLVTVRAVPAAAEC